MGRGSEKYADTTAGEAVVRHTTVEEAVVRHTTVEEAVVRHRYYGRGSGSETQILQYGKR
jgi:hypothetical protein